MMEVIKVMMKLNNKLFIRPNVTHAEYIYSKADFMPYFQDCIGALDGTHVTANVEPHLQQSFRNRKSTVSQNVLGVVNFDMTFSYVLAGWEGSAHDGRVLADALEKGLFLPEGKFYLGDAGYSLTPYCLTPYRGVR
jgi:hypothetical protein